MSDKTMTLTVVSQEKQLLSEEVSSVTAPAVMGEITVLPGHIPLLTKLELGELHYVKDNTVYDLVVSQGFINVEPENQVTVIVDAAKHVRDLSVEKAEKAMQAAQETMQNTTDTNELLMAEASLRQAMLEIKVAQKSKKAQI
jgi:F-type H+-transporting ATPase subunit epsilon